MDKQFKSPFEVEDVLELYRLLEEVVKELAYLKLENLVLEDFLEKNDPKAIPTVHLLLEQFKEKKVTETERVSSFSKFSSKGDESPSYSKHSLPSQNSSLQQDIRINLLTKVKLTEKVIVNTLNRLESFEHKAFKHIKNLTTTKEELTYQLGETNRTIKLFETNVVKLGVDPNTGIIPSEKYINFFHIWLKNGMALLGTMRLKMTAMQDQCYQQRAAIIRKSELSGILGPIDFEQLKIKKEDYTKILEEKNAHLVGLKKITGQAGLALTVQKRELLIKENELKQLNIKQAELIQNIEKLQKEFQDVQKEVDISYASFNKLKAQIAKYEAPTVNDYILMKEEILALDKEEKLLNRQMYILKIKVKNAMMKLQVAKAENY